MSVAGHRWNYLFLDEVSGYGDAARRCMDALDAAGIDLARIPFVPGGGWVLAYEPACGAMPREVTVAHLLPEYYPLLASARGHGLLVGHTAWETDTLPGHWRAYLEAVDLVVVPCTANAEVVRSAGVSTPVAVVPHVAAQPPARPGPAAWAGIPRDTFAFYTIGEWNARKAVFHTVRAYLRAFTSRDRVVLVVKTSPRDYTEPPPAPSRLMTPGTTPWAVARLLAEVRDPPAVRLITRTLDAAEIAAIHARGDCFVSLCRGEGWGLGAFDAAASGTPVIMTGWGGHLDYLSSGAALVDYDLVPVDHPTGLPSYTPDQRWAEPRIDHAVDLLRAAVTDRPAAIARAAALAGTVRRRYRPAVIAGALRSAVEQQLASRARLAGTVP